MGEGEGSDCPPKNVVSSDAAVGALPSDVPAKKLARQLDFTGFGGVSTGSVTLPEHSQVQLQLQHQSQKVSRTQPPPQTVSQQPVVLMPLPPQASHSSVKIA